MADPGLRVSPDLILPPDAVTKTFAFVAMVGAGKSNGGVVLAEEFHAAGLPFVVIDPKGDWYGMRSSGDGTGPGLPIPIFGGLHGDLPLLPEMGRLIADLIVDHNLTCILDVSEFASRAAQMRFLADFGEQLYRRHGKTPAPRHLILEEADEYLPQVVRADEARCVGVWTRIVKRGRQRGLGISILTQRCASVNKDGLSQCGTLVALRTIGAHDRKAILDWISYHDSPRDIVDSLPALLDGEACVISPQWLVSHGQPAVQRIRFRRRWTFDSGATPAFDQARPPATLADIDLGALGDRMAAVAEKAAADDPRALRRRIAELERQLAAASRETPAPGRVAELEAQLARALARPPERVEVPVVAAADLAAAEKIVAELHRLADGLEEPAARLDAALRQVAAAQAAPPAAAPARIPRTQRAQPERRPAPAGPAQLGGALISIPGGVTATRWPEAAPGEGPPRLKAGARNMLAVLARQHPVKITKAQLATLARLKVTGGTFGTYFSVLRRAGLITEDGGFVVLTEAGFAAAGASPDLPITAEELRETWRSALKLGARKMLDHLLARYPDPVARAELADLVELEQTGGTFGTYLSTLRRNGLAEETSDGIRAAEVFFLAGAGA